MHIKHFFFFYSSLWAVKVNNMMGWAVAAVPQANRQLNYDNADRFYFDVIKAAVKHLFDKH